MPSRLLQLLILLTLRTAPLPAAEIALRPGMPHPFAWEGDWQPLHLSISYFSLTPSPEGLSLWIDAHFQGFDSIIRLDGPALPRLNRPPPQLDARLIRYQGPPLDGLPAPILSRSAATRLRDGTLLIYTSVGPRYTGGGSELAPTLLRQRPGEAWEDLGPPAGDPAATIATVREHDATLRCEGAGIVELPDGRLRLYAHGLVDAAEVPQRLRNNRLAVNTLLIAEADTPEGPWHWRRRPDGTPIDLFANSPLPWLFAHIQPLGEHGWMLTGGSAWPPQQLYAAYSRDGLHFHLPADDDGRPLPLHRAADTQPPARFAKALRGLIAPGNRFHAVLSQSLPEHNGRSWLYHRTATFLPPAWPED